ncbi:flagellar biosynthetic protein FliR [Paraferrimonas sp. SM1919]|uniref:flagellar biosynthetic protein FliR n=1 Tax=Paraferrimonas sp. SM1919 TaxID=2662263 RepID=UPI0013D71722|nr:flagellar biosynthetic protein FliR [Paraferrimonas sp. SM1919]
MQWLQEFVSGSIAAYVWPFMRISAMFMVLTTIGSNSTPQRVRLLLSATITFAVAPALGPMPEIPLFSLSSFIIILQQLLIGIVIGFCSLLFMQTFVVGGQLIGMQTSLGFASMVDPANGQQVPIVGQFYLLLVTLLFFILDGHLTFILMLIQSFETIPVATTGLTSVAFKQVVDWGAWMFAGALTLALSAITALLLINLSFGVMTRAAPQLNIFAIGFPITMLSGLFILWLTLDGILLHYQTLWLEIQKLICQVVQLECTF